MKFTHKATARVVNEPILKLRCSTYAYVSASVGKLGFNLGPLATLSA